MTHIVIIGAGIGGIPAAYSIKAQLDTEGSVTVISDKDYFHFVPSNPWVAMGWRAEKDIAFPIEPYLAERRIEFIHCPVARVEPDQNQVILADGKSVSYDFLVLATGPEGAFDEVGGLAQHTYSVVHVEHARRARDAYQAFLRQPGPIVVGAVQGASILGPVYEFAFLADADLRRRNIRSRVPITVITPEPYPGHLGLGGDGETRRLMASALENLDVKVVCNARTHRLEAGEVHLAECDEHGAEKRHQRLPFAYCVYWPAFRGVAALRNSVGLTDDRGFVKVDEFLRSPIGRNIFAVGVCVSHPPADVTPVPVGAPSSAFSIQNEVDTVVKNIMATLHEEPLVSAAPQRAKWLSDIGEDGAAYLAEPQVPLRNINWLKQGRWVHLAKVEFEKYFLNRIQLKPAGRVVGVSGALATAIRQMQAATNEVEESKSFRHPRAQRLQVPVMRDLFYELRAMARALHLDTEALATELLTGAIQDAKTFLNARALDDMERARREILIAELPENQLGVEFEGGAP